jgi:hypothetical protein
MSTLDAEFFYAEHHNVPMHIGSVAVFDGPAPTRADLMRLFEAKLPRVPRYRQVVRATPFQLLRPVWADDQEFAIRHHVRHVSVRAPGGPEQLGAMAAKLFALPLDRHRPLWEEWLLDGLEGGRWAILSKIHHYMVDGIGGNELMTLVFDTAPDERVPEAAPWVPGPRSPLYVLGRPMTALYPYVPIGNAVRLSVAILSYVDTVSFGVTADYESVPDLNVFAAGIGRGLAQLSQAG